SASDYAGVKGILDGVCVFQNLSCNLSPRRDSRGSGGFFRTLSCNLSTRRDSRGSGGFSEL
ncbi:hypothetical protein, partial [Flavobacterium macacae]|uniref:hypothetical protein n=1 Tax=Flavobacterium macacae TaxID=2488993 RepID=UPI001F41FFF2